MMLNRGGLRSTFAIAAADVSEMLMPPGRPYPRWVSREDARAGTFTAAAPAAGARVGHQRAARRRHRRSGQVAVVARPPAHGGAKSGGTAGLLPVVAEPAREPSLTDHQPVDAHRRERTE